VAALARWLFRAEPASPGFPIHRSNLAFILALAFIALLTFVIFPARKVSVVADGVARTVASHQGTDVAVIHQAGVVLQPGDAISHQQARNGAEVILVDRATPVMAESSGRIVYWRTQAETVGGALAEIGVTLDDGDAVLVNGVASSARDSLIPLPARMVSRALMLARVSTDSITPQLPLAITVRRAVPFTVWEDGHSLDLRSAAATLSLALADSGILLGPGDAVFPDVDTPLSAGLSVEVYHADQVNVLLPEGTTVLHTRKATVEAALAEGGIPLSPLDRVEPDRTALVSNGMDVRVTRVSLGTVVENDDIPFKTVFRSDPDLAWGATRRTAGQNGVDAREYQVTYEDGQEVARTLLREWTAADPQDAVVYYSGAPAAAAAGMPDDLQVVKVMHVYATWYNPASAGKSSSSPSYGMTSTGVPVTRGIVAVDPSVIPYGTRMYIPGYGFGEAADCGGGVKGNMIDLGYPDGADVDWSSHYTDIYILG
jgi:uncharacterized protein YabE (DUF348 family)